MRQDSGIDSELVIVLAFLVKDIPENFVTENTGTSKFTFVKMNTPKKEMRTLLITWSITGEKILRSLGPELNH